MLRLKFYSPVRDVPLSLILSDAKFIFSEPSSLDKPSVIFLDEVDSTNEAVKRRLEAGQRSGGFGLVARRQTSGRGRLGNRWESLDGNLFMSVVVTLEAEEERRVAECSFVASLAVLDVLLECDPRLDVRLKWPNDVLVSASKVAGLLLEMHNSSLIIGIGVNLSCAPDLGMQSYAAACLAEHGIHLTLRDAAYAVYQRVSVRLEEWRQYGFPHILQAWKAYMFGVGSSVRVRLPKGEVQTGTLVSLADDGALILSVAGRLQRVLAADVLFDPCSFRMEG